jgi:hypothetical protein
MKTIHLLTKYELGSDELARRKAHIHKAYRQHAAIHVCHKQDGIWRCQHTSCTWRLPSFAIAKQELKVEVSA